MSGNRKIWVGVRLGMGGFSMGGMELSTSLKRLCGAVGASYSTAKKRATGESGEFEVRGEDGSFWLICRKEVIQVEGRGGKRG